MRAPRRLSISGATARFPRHRDGATMTNRPWHTLLTLLAVCGCSPPHADVGGRVLAAGKPVTGGSIVFAPIGSPGNSAPGKPGAAEITPDGSFALRLEPGTRGLAERYTVRFTPPVLPPMNEAEAKVTLPPPPMTTRL